MWKYYLLSRLESVSQVAAVIMGIGCIVAGICYGVYLDECYGEEEKEFKTKYSGKLKGLIAAFLIALFVGVASPSKKEIVAYLTYKEGQKTDLSVSKLLEAFDTVVEKIKKEGF